ncbi:MAG: 5-formyltetrahydrofolate cyclo-ligase [Nitrososphaeraceae archaeon]
MTYASSSSIATSKKILRSEMLAKRDGLPELEIHNKSKQIQEIFAASHFFKESRVLGVYVAHGSEVRTQRIIEAGFENKKIIGVPRVIDSSSIKFYEIEASSINFLLKGKFGIPEPKGTERDITKLIDLLIVPGIVFDLHGYRLGHGMGYYDRFLKSKENMTVIGLAYDFQLTKTRFLPHDNHDMKIDNILTETGFIPMI